MRCRVCKKEIIEDGTGFWTVVERTPDIISYSIVCVFDRRDPGNWKWHIPYSFDDYYQQLDDLFKL